MKVRLPSLPHGHGLSDDLPLILARRRQRRRAMTWIGASLGSIGFAPLSDAWSGPPGSRAGALGAAPEDNGNGSSGACAVADPVETGGPYPADGSNTAAGATSDILTSSGIVRSDIRSSFLGSTTTATGVPLVLTLDLVNLDARCAPLSGYAIYAWHCDRNGLYSLYTAPSESWLRGVQVSDRAGQVAFTTIFPACYPGRYPHIHLEVFASLAAATGGRNAILVTQLAMPAAVCREVYSGSTGYTRSSTNFARVSTASDGVFGDDSAAQIAAMTPTLTGSVAAGYAGAATVGIAR